MRFEWHYFHFIGDDISFNIILHKTDLFGIANRPYVSISMLNKNEKYYHKKVFNKNEELLEIYDFTKDLNPQNISIELNNLAINGTIKKIVTNLRTETELISLNGYANHWQVDIPYGKFRGDISVNGKVKFADFIVYKDHQWGELLIQKSVKRWVWGHFISPKTILIPFYIQLSDNSTISNYYSIDKDNKVIKRYSINDKECIDFLNQYRNLDRSTSIFSASNFDVVLKDKNCFRKRTQVIKNDFSFKYYRWSAQLEKNKIKIFNGITEYLEINTI